MNDRVGFLRALSAMDGPCMVERSLKVTQGVVTSGRVLVSVPRRALLPGARRTFLAICETLGAPDPGVLIRYLAYATDIHFGFEPGADPIHKAYLEFGQEMPIENVRFIAVKWRKGVARTNLYFDRTELPAAMRDALLSEVVPAGAVHDAMRAVMMQARDAAPLSDQPLLLVEEEETARRSLDLNFADLDWTMHDVGEAVEPLFLGAALPDELQDQRIGHIAGGIGQDGMAFATIYFGARPVSRIRDLEVFLQP